MAGLTGLRLGVLLSMVAGFTACTAPRENVAPVDAPRTATKVTGPEKIVLLDRALELQDEKEPFVTSVTFDFSLPSRPRRARLLLRYDGVPGATDEDYLMGRYRHIVELNQRYLMDLNTFSQGQEHMVVYTKWIPVGMLKRHNVLTFIAGHDGRREGRPDCDEYVMYSAVMELDW